MAINARSRIGKAPYIPESEKEQPNASTFTLRPLNGFELAEVMTEVYLEETGRRIFTVKGLRLATEYGLTKWTHVNDPDSGAEMPFSNENIAHLEPKLLLELANEIMDRSTLSEDERKN